MWSTVASLWCRSNRRITAFTCRSVVVKCRVMTVPQLTEPMAIWERTTRRALDPIFFFHHCFMSIASSGSGRRNMDSPTASK